MCVNKSEELKKYMAMRMALKGSLLTSDICGNNCIFCSNKLNPPEVHTFKIGNRQLEELINEIDYIPKDIREIHLGETTFNTTEGDFIEWPYWKELILQIKEKRPDIFISITTSGNTLTEDKIIFLKKYNIGLCLSIHSLDENIRAKLTGNTIERARIAINGLKLCLQYEINLFLIRIVPMPFVTDKDLFNTLQFLINKNIPEIQIWAASFSKFNKNASIELLQEECSRIDNVINSLNFSNSKTIVKLFPFSKRGEKAIIQYVNNETKLCINDEIIMINNMEIINGSHAKEMLYFYQFDEVELIIKRNNKKLLIKEKNIINNIIINENIPFFIIERIYNKTILDLNHTLIMTSEASGNEIYRCLQKMISKNFNFIKVKNNTFGGSICANGLISVQDYLIALQKYRQQYPDIKITKIIISNDSFQTGQKDVTGRPLQELKILGCVDVILI